MCDDRRSDGSSSVSRSAVSDSPRPRGLYPARLLRPWDSPDENTGVGCRDSRKPRAKVLVEASSPLQICCEYQALLVSGNTRRVSPPSCIAGGRGTF